MGDYVALEEGPLHNVARPLRAALGLAGVVLAGVGGYIARHSSQLINFAKVPKKIQKWPAFVPSEGINSVLVKPGPPGVMQAMPPTFTGGPLSLFVYSPASTQELVRQAPPSRTTEGWVYGAKLCRSSTECSLDSSAPENGGWVAVPTGRPEDVIKGRILSWYTPTRQETLRIADGIFLNAQEEAETAVPLSVERGPVVVVRKNGAVKGAFWYFTPSTTWISRAPPSPAPPKAAASAIILPSSDTRNPVKHLLRLKMEDVVEVRLLTVNDVYTIGQHEDGWGGYTTLSPMLAYYRGQVDNSLFMVNGDFLGGSSLAEHFQGRPSVEVLNQLGTDLTCIGNHEFDFGPESLQDRIKESNFPYLGANILCRKSNTLWPNIKATRLKSFSNSDKTKTAKVGFFGLCLKDTAGVSYPGPDLFFEEPIAAARRAVKELKEQGAHVIVGVTHLTLEQDIELARAVKGITLLVGGHDHTPVQQLEGTTLIFKSGQNAAFLGVIDLQIVFSPDDKEVGIIPSWRIVANYGWRPDPNITRILEKWARKQTEEEEQQIGDLSRVVLTLNTEMTSRTHFVRRQQEIFGELIANALDARFKPFGSELGVINGGFMRADRDYPKGHKLTVQDLKEEMPFPRDSVLLEIQGSQLMLALTQMSRLAPQLPSGGFPHLSTGWKFEWNENVSGGTTSVVPPPEELWPRFKSLTFNGQSVDPKRFYKVSVTGFVASGGDGCDAWKSGKQLHSAGQSVFALCMHQISLGLWDVVNMDKPVRELPADSQHVEAHRTCPP
eukprot:g47748.t1